MRRLRPSRRFSAGFIAVLVTVAGADIHPAMAADPMAAAAPTAERIAQFIASAASRFGIPQAWIYAVMRAESAGDQHAVSHARAMGLMQIMPATWSYLRGRYGLGADPFDAHDNITAGAAWLKELHDRYGSPGFLAAYNAGPARYNDHIATGRPLPPETRAYLAELAPIVGGKTTLAPRLDPFAWTRAALFPGQANAPQAPSSSAADPPDKRAATNLFIPLSGQARQP
jgi:soluble lytic murein transglycosylase-like protein